LSTKRVKLTVAYDGTDFCGWAAQAGRRTVQSTLTEAVRQVSDEDCEIIGASRTDSGAHALGQVCHFDTTRPIAAEAWVRSLNRRLPSDVRVLQARHVAKRFHSRFCAEDRLYRYRILTAVADPLKGRFAHELGRSLDLNLVEEAAACLVGKHDFRAFTESLAADVENTVRTLRKIRIRKSGPEVFIEIVGTAFLRGMMRRMAGVLQEVGRGQRPLEDVNRLLTPNGMKMHRPVVLPAKGLTLIKVRYGSPLRDCRLFPDS
jgi:tRNA pseudouridine38-40 synthase